jgi:hypothetical protein
LEQAWVAITNRCRYCMEGWSFLFGWSETKSDRLCFLVVRVPGC